MSEARRVQRMSSLLRSEVARLLLEEVSDPALRELTVTNVDLSSDLKHAHVYYTVPKDELTKNEVRELEKGFKRVVPYLRRKIGESLDLRYVPDLEFRLDEHGRTVDRLMHIMDDLGKPKESL